MTVHARDDGRVRAGRPAPSRPAPGPAVRCAKVQPMSPLDLLQALRPRPFEPFRVQVSDGTASEVRHPELVMVGLGSVSIVIPPAGEAQPVYERVETVSLAHVVKLVPLGAPVVGDGNGAG